MGSKTEMLRGALGEIINQNLTSNSAFFDLFAGAGSVARYVATRNAVRTVAVDQQHYSSILSGAVIERVRPLSALGIWSEWHGRVIDRLSGLQAELDNMRRHSTAQTGPAVEEARSEVSQMGEVSFALRDYGGYYFSPLQALMIGLFYQEMPEALFERKTALAALIRTASRCAASPGHTAQPFRPTDNLLPHIRSAWSKDVVTLLPMELKTVAPSHALVVGEAVVGDSVTVARTMLGESDVAFCDPPYSEAQYSRFYHVLEGISRGGWPSVSGAGRAPQGEERSSSDFSRRTRSVQAMTDLLGNIHDSGAIAIITYPEGARSNGLTIESIRDIANGKFDMSETRIEMKHSTLGGSSLHESSRSGAKHLFEVVAVLRPR